MTTMERALKVQLMYIMRPHCMARGEIASKIVENLEATKIPEWMQIEILARVFSTINRRMKQERRCELLWEAIAIIINWRKGGSDATE